jgi:hypothetical protein
MKIPVGKIPKFIAASSLKGLQRLMLRTQAMLGYGVNWFDIQFVKKEWVAFYYDNDDITLHNIEEKLNDASDG